MGYWLKSLNLANGGSIQLCQFITTDFLHYYTHEGERYVKSYGHNFTNDLPKGNRIYTKIYELTNGKNLEYEQRGYEDISGSQLGVSITGNGWNNSALEIAGIGDSGVSYFGFGIYIDENEHKAWIQTLHGHAQHWIDLGRGNYTIGSFFSSTDPDLSAENLYTNILGSGSSDPYGTDSPDDGGNGKRNTESDDIDFPEIPETESVDCGFLTVYTPNETQLHNFASYLWNTDLFDISTLQKLFQDPMGAILGLSLVPVNVNRGGVAHVKLGNIETSVEMYKLSSQYVEVDCGSVSIDENIGCYLDYSPYTKIEIFLPYCGTHALSVDDVMNKSVHVKYVVDVLTGSCCAMISTTTTDGKNAVLYTFNGSCAKQLPVNSNNWNSILTGAISTGIGSATMIASMGASGVVGAVGMAANNAMSSKADIVKSGSITGSCGFLSVQTPYIIITRAKPCIPKNQNTYIGYPSFSARPLNELSGFTVVDSIHLENISATDVEKNEIEKMLKEGIII